MMRVLKYTNINLKKQVLCLGFFDSIHLGHIKLIKEAKILAHLNGAKLSLLTFINNPFEIFSNQKLIYTFSERLDALKQLDIDYVYYANFNQEFANLSKEKFLKKLLKFKNISTIVCGKDYTFGKDKEGNVEYLQSFCKEHDIGFNCIDLIEDNNEKISSSYIRELVKKGDVDKINSLIISPYMIKGIVQKGKGIGHSIYPTANIYINKNKEILKDGVYYTQVLIDGVRFRAITNVGYQPTFDTNDFVVETHILYYDKDLYGKEITIEFLEKIRDIQKFNTKEELKEQISNDIKYVNSLNGGNDD